MPRIERNAPHITLINLFTVEPERQEELAELIDQATEVMQTMPGFISTAVHASIDGTRVVNYAQWESRAHLEEMFKNEDAQKYLKAIGDIASNADPNVYQVSHVWE